MDGNAGYKDRLSELGITPWKFYDAKSKYAPKEEGENRENTESFEV